MSENRRTSALIADARRALMALRLEVPAVVADDVTAKVEALIAENETLRAALDTFGQHKASCAANYSATPAMAMCDCGLAGARGGDAA